MKIKNLLLAGLVVLGMTACSNNDEPTPDNGAKYDTYLQLSISSPTLKTEGTQKDPSEGTESDIKSVHIYLLNADNTVASSYAEAGMTEKATKAFEVPTGTYNLVVVANPTAASIDDLGAVDAAFAFDKLIEGVDKAAAQEGYKKDALLMTTAFNDVERVAPTVTISSTDTKAKPAKADAFVDRVSVKIVDEGLTTKVAEGTTVDATTEALIIGATYKGYVLINGNEKFNLFQKWGKITGDAEGKVLMTPQGTVTPGTGVTGYYNPLMGFGLIAADGIYDKLVDGDLNAPKAKIYTTENRPDFMFTEGNGVLTSGKSTTTGLIYQVIANEGKTFYSYRGVVYVSDTEVAALKEIKELKDLNLDWANLPAVRKAGVKVYENGKMYYTYYIEDQNYTIKNNKLAAAAAVKYNAVMRNAVYKITVNGLKDLGDDVPGGGIDPTDPNPPIVTDKSYLQVTVKVNDWVLNTIGVDL